MFIALSISHLSITSVGGGSIGTICQTGLSIYLRLTIAGLKHSLIFRNVSRIIYFREFIKHLSLNKVLTRKHFHITGRIQLSGCNFDNFGLDWVRGG